MEQKSERILFEQENRANDVGRDRDGQRGGVGRERQRRSLTTVHWTLILQYQSNYINCIYQISAFSLHVLYVENGRMSKFNERVKLQFLGGALS